jgi:DeoR/GlpR family transcriptional regulator of sugar metabolism
MSLNTQQRREQILTHIYEHGFVEVKQLANLMGVSEATVRRDLRALADSKQLELVYGGATLPRTSDFSFRSKSQRNIEAKRVIGRLAASLVGDHEQLYLDSGTTCFEMCAHLKRKRGLSVIVNSARLAVELGGSPELSVIMIGGHYRADRMDTVGPLASTTIDQLRGYLAFIGADGLSMDFGTTASDIESAHLYRQAIHNARETILVIDHSKFLTPSLFKIADLDAFSRVVTDKPPLPEWRDFLNGKGIDVLYPEPTSSPYEESSYAEESDDHAGQGPQQRASHLHADSDKPVR